MTTSERTSASLSYPRSHVLRRRRGITAISRARTFSLLLSISATLLRVSRLLSSSCFFVFIAPFPHVASVVSLSPSVYLQRTTRLSSSGARASRSGSSSTRATSRSSSSGNCAITTTLSRSFSLSARTRRCRSRMSRTRSSRLWASRESTSSTRRRRTASTGSLRATRNSWVSSRTPGSSSRRSTKVSVLLERVGWDDTDGVGVVGSSAGERGVVLAELRQGEDGQAAVNVGCRSCSLCRIPCHTDVYRSISWGCSYHRS